MSSRKMQYPSKCRMVVVRDCTVAICLHINPGAVLMSTLLFWYENPHDGDIWNEEAQTFTVRRTQADIVTAACQQIDAKTIHDTAVPLLWLLGFLEVREQMNGNLYTLHIDRIIAAFTAYEQGRQTRNPNALKDYLKSLLQLESALIHMTDEQLEAALINKRRLYLQLEAALFAIREKSNCKRGRKPKSQAGAEAQSEVTESIESIESNYQESVYVDANAQHTTLTRYQLFAQFPFLLFDDPERPTTITICHDVLDASGNTSEMEDDRRANLASDVVDYLTGKGMHITTILHEYRTEGKTIEGDAHATTNTPAPAQLDTAPADMDSRRHLPATSPVSENDAHFESQAEPYAYSQPSLQLTQGEIHATTYPLSADDHHSSVITDLHPAEMDTARTESEVMPPVAAGAIRSSSSIGAVFLAQEPECLADIPTFARERAALAADVCALPEFSTGDVDNCGDAEETVQGRAAVYSRPRLRKTVLCPVTDEQASMSTVTTPPVGDGNAGDGAREGVNAVRIAPPDNAVLIDTGKQAAVAVEKGQKGGKGRTSPGQSKDKGRKKPVPVIEDAPLPLTFTAQGQALWDAWASIFKTMPTPQKADTLAANDLAPKIAVWAQELSLSRREVLNKIRGWLWAKDRQKGYYRERGMYLFDLAREFGGWQEAAERKLEENALLTAPPRGRQQTSVVTPEMLAAARAAREAGKSVQVIDVNGKLEVVAR